MQALRGIGSRGAHRRGRACRRQGQAPTESRRVGLADDYEDADGERVLSFAQAQEKARERAAPAAVPSEAMSVGDVLEAYLSHLEKDFKSVGDARSRTRAHILPAFGKTAVGDLTTPAISKWHKKLATTPARVRSSKGAPLQFKKTLDEETSRRRRSTANRTLTVLKAALNFAAKGRPGPAPWRDVKPYAGVDTARVRYLSIDEAQRLINACPLSLPASGPGGARDRMPIWRTGRPQHWRLQSRQPHTSYSDFQEREGTARGARRRGG